MHPTPEPWLIDAARQRVHQFATQLRSGPDAATQVPGLDWTVADLGQHLACLASFWTSHHNAGADFELPDDVAAMSDRARAHITETDLGALADLIETEFGSTLDSFVDDDSLHWLYGRQVSARTLCGLTLQETVLHGRDLAAVPGFDSPGGKAPMFDRREANATVDAVMAIAPVFIDPSRAREQPDGTYHLRFKDGNDYTWIKRDDALDVSLGRPEKADARLVADPGTFLLSSFGRISQIRAGLSGKLISYGRRPWRFLGLGNIAVDGT